MPVDYNAELLKLYEREIAKLPPTDDFTIQPAHPFLLSIPKGYDKKIKVMIFGQETNGWLEDLHNDPQKAMERYDRFWIQKKSKYSKRGTFQQVLNTFQDMLDRNSVSCVWNNIIKIGKAKDKGKPPRYLINWQENWFKIIQQEVKLLKPDFLIFFTGPYYDEFIKKALGEFEKSKVMGRTTRQIAKLNFLENDSFIAFRTYHPNYLRRSKLEKTFLNYFREQIHSVSK